MALGDKKIVLTPLIPVPDIHEDVTSDNDIAVQRVDRHIGIGDTSMSSISLDDIFIQRTSTDISINSDIRGSGSSISVVKDIDDPVFGTVEVSNNDITVQKVTGNLSVNDNIPITSNDITVQSISNLSAIDSNVQVSGNENIIYDIPQVPGMSAITPAPSDIAVQNIPDLLQINSDIPITPNDIVIRNVSEESRINDNVQVSGDETNIRKLFDTPNINDNVQTSDSDIIVQRPIVITGINDKVPQSNDDITIQNKSQVISIEDKVNQSSDEIVVRNELSRITVNDNVEKSNDETTVQKVLPLSPISTEIPQIADDINVQRPSQPIIISTELSQSEDSPSKQFQSMFNGKWVTWDDPLLITAENYNDVSNLRYTNYGLEGVGGFTKINSSAIYAEASGQSSIKNGIQLRTNYTQTSYVIVQAEDNNDVRYLYCNNATVPNTRNFDCFFIKTAINDTLRFTSDQGGPVTITLTEGAYTSTTLATEIAARMNANTTLTGSHIVFAVTYSMATRKFTIDATAGHWIDITVSSTYTASDTIGFTTSTSITGQTITSNISVGYISYNGTTAALSQLYTEASGAGLARFALLPQNSVGVCDGKNNLIWSGDEMQIGAFYRYAGTPTDSDGVVDYTDRVTNTLTDSANVVTISAASSVTYLIGTMRPANGFKITVGTANTANPSTMTVSYWNGSAFTACTVLGGSLSDGTLNAAGTITLANSGNVIITTAKTNETPYLLKGCYLYFYLLTVSAVLSSPTIVNITANSGMQDLIDIWDGTYRNCINFTVRADGNTKQYTLEVAKETYNSATSLLAAMGAFDGTNAEALYAIFTEPMAAFKIKMGTVNDTASTLAVEYNGISGYAAVTVDRDTCKAGGTKAFANSGFIYFSKEAITDEYQTTRYDTYGYVYRLYAATTAGTTLDTFHGIPQSNVVKTKYIFPFAYQNRAMWCGSTSDGERNRVDFSITNNPNVYNGPDSSGYNHERSLYFGDYRPLTAAANAFVKRGDTVENIALFFKDSEVYSLSGYNIDTFRISRVSQSIGCPSPLTVVSIETAYLFGAEQSENIVMWLSSYGPVAYVNNSIVPIPGVESYFDPSNTLCITSASFPTAHAWFDHIYKEYNIIFQNAAGDVWLVYNILYRKWYRKYCDNAHPSGAFPVMDSNGMIYNYAYGDSGYLLRLENGLNWGSASYLIDYSLTTADIIPFEDIWKRSAIRAFKVIHKTNTVTGGSGTLTVTCYTNGNNTAETTTTLPTSNTMAKSGYRYANLVKLFGVTDTAMQTQRNALSYKFKFDFTNCTSKPQLLAWGFDAYEVMDDKVEI